MALEKLTQKKAHLVEVKKKREEELRKLEAMKTAEEQR
jgi:hypothetical protein